MSTNTKKDSRRTIPSKNVKTVMELILIVAGTSLLKILTGI